MFSIRPFVHPDIPLLAQFLRWTHRHDASFDVLEEESLLDFINQECNAGGRDFCLAMQNGEIVGALLSGRFMVHDRDKPIRGFRIIVTPSARGQGLGRMLLEELKRQDEDHSVVRRSVLSEDWPAAGSMLKEMGFHQIRQALIMQRTGLPLEYPAFPPGFVFRDANLPEDANALTTLYNVANRKAFGFAPLSPDELLETVGTPGGRLMVVEEKLNGLVGSIQTLPYVEGVGVIFAVQVAPHHQRRGFGRFLVIAAVNALAQQGFRAVELAVDASNTAAVTLYASLGFEVIRRDLTFEENASS